MASTRNPRNAGALALTEAPGVAVEPGRSVEPGAGSDADVKSRGAPAGASAAAGVELKAVPPSAQGRCGDVLVFAGLTAATRGRNDDRWQVAGEIGLLVLADGVSGYPAGDLAAEIAVRTACQLVPDLLRHGLSEAEALRRSMAVCNDEIREFAASRAALEGMATTLVCALVRAGGLHIAHVGDSRAYRLRAGRLERLTRDHCVGQQIIDTGRLSEAEVGGLAARGILTRALGLADRVEPELAERPWQVDDTVILCSDGLTTALADPVVEQLLIAHAPEGPAGQVRALIGGVLQTGTAANITALVATPADRPGPVADLDRPH